MGARVFPFSSPVRARLMWFIVSAIVLGLSCFQLVSRDFRWRFYQGKLKLMFWDSRFQLGQLTNSWLWLVEIRYLCFENLRLVGFTAWFVLRIKWVVSGKLASNIPKGSTEIDCLINFYFFKVYFRGLCSGEEVVPVSCSVLYRSLGISWSSLIGLLIIADPYPEEQFILWK